MSMVTGARRGEVCALRWGDVDWPERTLWVRRNYVTKAGRKIIKETKSHQARRLSLDEDTLNVLREHRDRCRALGRQQGGDLSKQPSAAFPDPSPPHPGGLHLLARRPRSRPVATRHRDSPVRAHRA